MRPECPVIRRTEHDEAFYDRCLKGRMPKRIYDFHIHINLPEHIPEMSEERLHSDWAFECGLVLPSETACRYAGLLFPDSEYRLAGFPWPVREADLISGNRYLLEKKEEGLTTPFMAVGPDFTEGYIEEQLPNFCGFKPYPDLVSTVKGAEISIFSFLPHWQLEILNRHRKAVVIHLPRKGRIADPENVRELLEMRQRYPDIRIVIAHFGRSFNPIYLREGLELMGGGAADFYYDTAAVLNPAVYELAFRKLPPGRILYGSDAPIMLWHGKRRWTERTYINLTSEPYFWNRHQEGDGPASSDRLRAKRYTFVLYEQMKAILDVLEHLGLGEEVKQDLFFENTRRLLEECGGRRET